MIESNIEQLLTHDCPLIREIAKELISRNFSLELTIVKGVSQGKPFSIFSIQNGNQINKILITVDCLHHLRSSEIDPENFLVDDLYKVNQIDQELKQICDWVESKLTSCK